MNTKRILFSLLIGIAGLLAACSGTAPAPTPQTVAPSVEAPTAAPTAVKPAPTDPIAIVQLYYEALNVKDIDTAMSFIADDAVFANPTGKYVGKDEIRASLDGQANANITFELSHFREGSGRVVYDYRVLQNGGLLESGTDGVTIVKDGKIVFDGTERTELSTDADSAGMAELTFTAKEYSFDGPGQTAAGWTKLTLVNQGQEGHHIQLVKLDEGKTQDDLKAALTADPENFPAWAEPYGGPNAPDPGGSTSALVNLEPGIYALICVIPDAQGTPHLQHGMLKTLTVIAASGATVAEPTADLTVDLADFSFDVSGSLTAGERVIRFVNKGKQVHEAFLVKLEAGKTAEDYLNTPPGTPPPGISLGGITGIPAGAAQHISVKLEPGTYALFCFFPDPTTHAPHFAQGMVQEFTVQ